MIFRVLRVCHFNPAIFVLFVLTETEVPKWSMVLFDWIGCTLACVESRRFTDQPCVKIGSRTQLSYDGQLHLVEILALESKCFSVCYDYMYVVRKVREREERERGCC